MGHSFTLLSAQPRPPWRWNDALDNGQAYSSTFIISGAVETLKDTEEIVVVFHIETDAIVPDIIDRLVVFDTASHIDPGYISSTGELNGVAQQIAEKLPHERPITHRWSNFFDEQGHLSVGMDCDRFLRLRDGSHPKHEQYNHVTGRIFQVQF